MQFQLMQDFYEECEVDPRTINFIEAHGTGTKVLFLKLKFSALKFFFKFKTQKKPFLGW